MLPVSHIVMGIMVIACGRSDNTKPPRHSENTTAAFNVALLTPGPISDQSWNGGAYEGLMRIRDSLGAHVSHVQTKTPAEFEENFRQYGASGYSLVFGHGFEFQDAAERVGPDYPKTIYITTGGDRTSANVAAMALSFDEPAFLAGMVAGSVTETGTVGCIGGTELPPVKSSFAAFTAGVHAVNPRAKIIVSYIGNWDDASAGKEQALAQMGRGVDVIFQNADAAGLGIFQAVKETAGRWIIGSNANQNGIMPSVTLGSVVIDLPHAFLTVAREVRNGTFRARVIRLDTKSEAVSWTPNPSLASIVPALARQKVDSVQALMLAHAFALPVSFPSAK
jgi:basic membrane protein A